MRGFWAGIRHVRHGLISTAALTLHDDESAKHRILNSAFAIHVCLPLVIKCLFPSVYSNIFSRMQQAVPLCPTIVLSSTNNLSALRLMSHTSTATSSSNSKFQLIFNSALKAYHKRTKNDLLLHPLAAQLQTCDSPGDILAVLQEQVQGLDQSRSGNERWTKWLDPTINVLLAFSGTLGAGVGLVCPRTSAYLRSAFSYLSGRYSHPRL